MTLIGKEGQEIHFASSFVESEASRNRLNLAPHIADWTKKALNALPIFKGVETAELCREATEKLRGRRTVSDRFTAILVIAGTRALDHPDLQQPPVAKSNGLPRYAI
jgi:hypothetical protein